MLNPKFKNSHDRNLQFERDSFSLFLRDCNV